MVARTNFLKPDLELIPPEVGLLGLHVEDLFLRELLEAALAILLLEAVIQLREDAEPRRAVVRAVDVDLVRDEPS